MRDAYQRRLRQSLPQQLVDMPLGVIVERRGRFVEEEPIRSQQKHAGNSEALLLSRAELERPVLFLVQPIDEPFEAVPSAMLAAFGDATLSP